MKSIKAYPDRCFVQYLKIFSQLQIFNVEICAKLTRAVNMMSRSCINLCRLCWGTQCCAKSVFFFYKVSHLLQCFDENVQKKRNP